LNVVYAPLELPARQLLVLQSPAVLNCGVLVHIVGFYDVDTRIIWSSGCHHWDIKL
jgi:hypothetical protein